MLPAGRGPRDSKRFIFLCFAGRQCWVGWAIPRLRDGLVATKFMDVGAEGGGGRMSCALLLFKLL